MPSSSAMPGSLLRPMGESFTYTIHYEEGGSLEMPFSRELHVGDTWKDTVAEWKVVRIAAGVSGEAVDVWVEPVRD
jgi:hypothetical protein